MLFHIIFAGKGFATLGAGHVLFARMLFAMAGGVARGGEGIEALVLFPVWARIFLLVDFLEGVGGVGRGRRRKLRILG